jgi:hypothetical protein
MQAADIGDVISIAMSGKHITEYNYCLFLLIVRKSEQYQPLVPASRCNAVQFAYEHMRRGVESEKIVDGNKQLEYILKLMLNVFHETKIIF